MNIFRFIKTKIVLAISLTFLILSPILLSQSAGAVIATGIAVGDLHYLANQERSNAGLSTLSFNSQLSAAATAKAADMFADDYWAHVAPDGTTPWVFILGAGYDYTSAGENLAKGYSTAAGVINGWMESPTHRANLLSASYKDVGYAVMSGVLQGVSTTLVVAMYGAPVVSSTPTPAPSPTSVTTAPAETETEEVVQTPSNNTQESSPVVASTPSVSEETQETETQETTSTEKTIEKQQSTKSTTNTSATTKSKSWLLSLMPVKVFNRLQNNMKNFALSVFGSIKSIISILITNISGIASY